MNTKGIEIEWPDGQNSIGFPGDDWIKLASEAGIEIPTGCLGGCCGACEIEVDGKIIRACINKLTASSQDKLKVEFAYDPFW